MDKYRKKPVVIEAIQFTDKSKSRVNNFVRCNTAVGFDGDNPILKIQTPEGTMITRISDWVIKGVNGEFYPCKDDIFQKTYKKVE